MPDGSDSNGQLEPIYTLRELMVACRQRVPAILKQMDIMLASPELFPADKIKLCEMILNRAYGKPRQTVIIDENRTSGDSRVRVYLPDNGRSNYGGEVIEASSGSDNFSYSVTGSE